MTLKYQYEIYLPLTDNDGSRIPSEKFEQITRVIIKLFGGLTIDTLDTRSAKRGVWHDDDGRPYVDMVTILRVVTDETHDTFFVAYMETLKNRFEQKDIFVTRTKIEKLESNKK